MTASSSSEASELPGSMRSVCGIAARIPPRPTVEVNEAGDRVIYGAHLFKQGKAPRILCTGNVATGGSPE